MRTKGGRRGIRHRRLPLTRPCPASGLRPSRNRYAVRARRERYVKARSIMACDPQKAEFGRYLEASEVLDSDEALVHESVFFRLLV